ncbi:hypothetical protein [Fimbriimonas ginsengisoli]|uniref:Phage integrase n=1 Tax=Fimbriimonas ginsengisoli Gsoil 348 TaxID=661478 RepID=A0A068NSM9_FIMGI|nr:hypothetical protein [Fimbriimonas ginsengisoli]AIE86362.1 phage integrase [Fimbriimonas ginsengisoli Gsoil 348]
MEYKPKGRRPAAPANREKLPAGIRRGENRRIYVDFQERFLDGTAFRRTKDFDPEALKVALNFLARAKAEFARGNGVGEPETQDGVLTVAAWCEHCLTVAMPAQKNGKSPKYSDESLVNFRQVVQSNIVPRIGKIRIDELTKAAVADLISALPSDEARAKTLYVLTRVMELAESKGKRKKGTNPCKGVSPNQIRRPDRAKTRPSNWREEPA